MQFYYVKMCNSTLITIIIINFPDKKEVEAVGGAASRMRIEFNYFGEGHRWGSEPDPGDIGNVQASQKTEKKT